MGVPPWACAAGEVKANDKIKGKTLIGVPVAKEPKTSIRASAGNTVEKNDGLYLRPSWTKTFDFLDDYR
jgi:hypothetical protein